MGLLSLQVMVVMVGNGGFFYGFFYGFFFFFFWSWLVIVMVVVMAGGVGLF